MSEPSSRPTPPGSSRAPAAADPETRREVEAALATRAELGPDFEDHIAAALADRVEQLAARRTVELKAQSKLTRAELEAENSDRHRRFVLGIISLGAGIPISGIAATQVDPGLIGLAVAWAGIVGVNVAAGLRIRRRR